MCKLRRYLWIGLVLNGFVALPARAGVIFEPYYSVGSTKSIKPQRASGTEKETISQREEKGLRAGLILASWLKLVLGVGESYQLTTSKESQIRDEYGELDFAADLGTTPVGVEQKKKELQRRASFTFVFDPSFSIFILRTKAGVTARQRIVKLYTGDVLASTLEPAPTYKPHAGVGLGVRFGPRMYFVAEYGFYFYQFPKTEPFERELTISYGFRI